MTTCVSESSRRTGRAAPATGGRPGLAGQSTTAALARKTALAEAAFNRGRDLAVAMIDAGDDLADKDPDSASPYRAYRYGKAQVRFTEQFLLQLLADPSMLDGFDAVLSAKLADQCIVSADFYRFSKAEYSEGVVGADGTMSDPVNQDRRYGGSK